MNKVYDLNSILNAIENINNKPKKKITPIILDNSNKTDYSNTSKKETIGNNDILPITEKLILEAEEHSKKFINNHSFSPAIAEDVLMLNEEYQKKTLAEDVLILNQEYHEESLENFNSEEIKLNIIDDLYSSLSKKVKKNTLKTIFDLHKKINELKKKIKDLKINSKDKDSTQDNNTAKLTKNTEHLINEDYLNFNEEHLVNEENFESKNEHLINDTENNLSEDIMKTLKYQNSLIKKFEINEEKLLLKIVDLEQDITLLSKKSESDNSKSKIESESIFYKENYERLIIENNEVKKKLINSKKQIIMFEKNIKELMNGFENLNNILSKNSIINLNVSSVKDSSILVSSEENTQKLKISPVHTTDENKK